MTSFYGPNAAFYSTGPGSAKDLISRIEAMSNGRIKIQFYGAGELIPAAEGFRRGLLGHGRDELRQFVFLDRQELRRAILHRRAVRPQLSGLQRLVLRRRRRPALARGVRPLQSRADPCGQHRRADDGLVPQGDQDRRRSQRHQDAHPRSRGARLQGTRRRLAPDRTGRNLPQPRTRRDRRGRIRRAIPRPTAWPAQGREILLHDRLARDGDAPAKSSSTRRSGTACPPTSRRLSRTPARPAT